MSDDLQRLDYVGANREERLVDAGYDSFEDISEASPDELSNDVSYLSSDKALEIIAQAGDMAELEEAEAVVNPSVEEVTDSESDDTDDSSGEDDPDDSSEDESTESGAQSNDGPESYEVAIDIETAMQYDVFYDGLTEYRKNIIRTNIPGADTVSQIIERLRNADVGDTIRVTLTRDELNSFHNAMMQHRQSYRGGGLNDHLDAMRSIEEQINRERKTHLL